MTFENNEKLFLEYGKQAVEFVRHYEEVRFKFSQLAVTLSAALIGIDRFGGAQPKGWLVPTLIIFLGICGILVTMKYTERADRHAAIARQLRQTLSSMSAESGAGLLKLNYQEGARKHKERTGLMATIRARYFWMLLHGGVVALGILMLMRT